MSVTQKTIKSSIVIMCSRLVQRSIGIVSLLILSRLLTPTDFGVVALATMLVFLCDSLSESGAQQYIIQKKQLDDVDLNTAWSLNILLKSLLAMILMGFSSLLADFFEEPTLQYPLLAIALILPLSALANPGVILLRREFKYGPIFKLDTIEKLTGTATTITLAFIWQSYWAMICGVIVSYLVKCLGSYWIHAFRPSFTLCKLKEQWTFSQWLLLKSLVGYMKSELDTVIITKYFGLSALGGYNLMKNISSIPGRELIRPMTEPLLAAFYNINHDKENFKEQILNSLTVLLVLTASISVYLIKFDVVIVQVLFNEQWYEYAPLLGYLSVFIINYTLIAVLQEALTSVGKVKFQFYFDLVVFVLTVSMLLSLFTESLMVFTMARVSLAVISVIILCGFLTYILGISMTALVIRIIPIGIALLVAVYASSYVTMASAFGQFFVGSAVYFIVYLITLPFMFRIFQVFSDVAKFNLWATEIIRTQYQKLRPMI
jgi:lipopolysaccharide exporter